MKQAFDIAEKPIFLFWCVFRIPQCNTISIRSTFGGIKGKSVRLRIHQQTKYENNNKYQFSSFRFLSAQVSSLLFSLLFCFDLFSRSFVMLLLLGTHFNLLNSKRNNSNFQFVHNNSFQ